MAQELIFTAATRGLIPGTSGLCIVAMSPDMSKAVAEKLSKELSEYEHPFPAGSGQNPERLAYYRLTIAGQRVRVISRVVDAGLDPFTRRSNVLAHHLVLAENERPQAGPAWLVQQPGLFDDAWQGEPRALAGNRKAIPQGAGNPPGARTWAMIVGDAGWAGVVAEHLLTKPNAPYTIISPSGTPTAMLIQEVLSLLPPERRWDVTFSTWFTSVPGGASVSLRCVLDGSPQAATARSGPHLDLARIRGTAPPNGAGVEAARRGTLLNDTVASPTPTAPLFEDMPSVIPLSGTRLPTAPSPLQPFPNASIPPRPSIVPEPPPLQVPMKQGVGKMTLVASALLAFLIGSGTGFGANYILYEQKLKGQRTANEKKPAEVAPNESEKPQTTKPPENQQPSEQWVVWKAVSNGLPPMPETAFASVKKRLTAVEGECKNLKDRLEKQPKIEHPKPMTYEEVVEFFKSNQEKLKQLVSEKQLKEPWDKLAEESDAYKKLKKDRDNLASKNEDLEKKNEPSIRVLKYGQDDLQKHKLIFEYPIINNQNHSIEPGVLHKTNKLYLREYYEIKSNSVRYKIEFETEDKESADNKRLEIAVGLIEKEANGLSWRFDFFRQKDYQNYFNSKKYDFNKIKDIIENIRNELPTFLRECFQKEIDIHWSVRDPAGKRIKLKIENIEREIEKKILHYLDEVLKSNPPAPPKK